MQELRAQIQAQIKLADTLRKLAEHAGGHLSLHIRDVSIGHVLLFFRKLFDINLY